MSKDKAATPKNIPTAGTYQYIFKKDSEGIIEAEPIPGYSFKYINNIFDVNGSVLREMSTLWKLSLLLRGIAKIITPSRKLYYMASEKGPVSRIVSHGWITAGKCKRYKVSRKGVVIGFICTDEKERGKGLAAYALINALNALFKSGYREIYMDTYIENTSTQRLIKKCGFRGPIDFYLRTKDCYDPIEE